MTQLERALDVAINTMEKMALEQKMSARVRLLARFSEEIEQIRSGDGR